jgi:hypothetical protein
MLLKSQRVLPAVAALITVISFAAEITPRPIPMSAFWKDPADIASRDVFYGPGGTRLAPRSMEFQFLEEDTSGTTPKYIVRDKHGVTWKMKLGPEARPSVAASRVVWAAGYHAYPEYFLASAYVHGVPSQLRRGRTQFDPAGGVHHIRLQRVDFAEKTGDWKWRESPFARTKEFNGLRTLMALLNNWDLKDSNNGILRRPDGSVIYCVSDLGASFGGTVHGKGKASSYASSSLIDSVESETVDFNVPAIPPFIEAIAVPVFVRRVNMRWIGQDIPRTHARWLGNILGRLSRRQVRDIFKASGFSPEEVETFAVELEGRIAELRSL